MSQSRMFITTATRCLILIGIIVSVHGKAQNQNGYRPVFGSLYNQVDIFEEDSINPCLINVTAKTYDGTVANGNVEFQLKDDIPHFEINNNGCLRMKPGMTISKTNDNPTLTVIVIAVDARNRQYSSEIAININFESSDTNVNRKLIKIQSSHWFDDDHDINDDEDKRNVIGISETIEPFEPIMTVTNMTQNVSSLTSVNDKNGIFRFENHQLYANKDKLNFKNKNGIGMRDFDFVIFATNDQHQYQYRKIKIKTLRSRGSPPVMEIPKSVLKIEKLTNRNECLFKLDARDPEPEIGSTIHFEIIKPTDYFSVDENGCIQLKEAFDHECAKSHDNCPSSPLKVGVFFEGHFSETVISFEILVDHAPELKIKNATIYERKKSKLIAKLTAIDKDSNVTNSKSFKFEINNDSNYPDGKKFEIKNGNELHNIVPLYVNEKKTKYEISINVRDTGYPPQSHTSIFTVEIKKKNGLKFVQSKYIVFVSENGEVGTPVTKYFWVINNSGPVDYKLIRNDPENYFSVAQTYDSDMDIYYGQVLVKKNLNYRKKANFTYIDIKASDSSSSDILTVQIYFINVNKPVIELEPLRSLYSAKKEIVKNSVECIATVHVTDGSSLASNPIQYNISEASSERYLSSSTYSEEVVKGLFVKIDKDTGCIQIQKYNGLYQNELMVVRAYYKHDDSLKPFISRRLIRIRIENPKDQKYNVTVTDGM